MDTSSHVKAIISGACTYEDSDEIIGEIQFCYLTGMRIGNAACMDHWVRLLLVSYLPSFYEGSKAPTLFQGVGVVSRLLVAYGSSQSY